MDPNASKDEPDFKTDIIAVLAQLKITDAEIIIPRLTKAISLFSRAL